MEQYKKACEERPDLAFEKPTFSFVSIDGNRRWNHFDKRWSCSVPISIREFDEFTDVTMREIH
jgi:hypothetical protein